MKKLMIVLWLTISYPVFSQSFYQEWKQYEDYCNEMVDDTMTIYGELIGNMVPVRDSNGDIIEYVMLYDGDTIWDDFQCNKYKTIYGYQWWYDDDDVEIVDSIKSHLFYGKRSLSIQVSKQYICKVKRSKPSFDGFIIYLKKRYEN